MRDIYRWLHEMEAKCQGCDEMEAKRQGCDEMEAKCESHAQRVTLGSSIASKAPKETNYVHLMKHPVDIQHVCDLVIKNITIHVC